MLRTGSGYLRLKRALHRSFIFSANKEAIKTRRRLLLVVLPYRDSIIWEANINSRRINEESAIAMVD